MAAALILLTLIPLRACLAMEPLQSFSTGAAAGGATLEIPGKARASIPAGSLVPGTRTFLELFPNEATRKGFGSGPDDEIFAKCVLRFLPYDVLFSVGGATLPAADTEFSIWVPKNLRPVSGLQQVAVSAEWESRGEEGLGGFDRLASTFDPKDGRVRAKLPSRPLNFFPYDAEGRSYAARLVVTLVDEPCIQKEKAFQEGPRPRSEPQSEAP